MIPPVLYIFGGLPGTGKSTLASALARRCNAVYIRIDTIEQALRDIGVDGIKDTGYAVGYALALENLRLGATVVADSVNPLAITRRAWTDVARQAHVQFVEIEIICSDQTEHRSRAEGRVVDIAGLKLPNWKGITDREYDAWDTKHLVLDTAGQTLDESKLILFELLQK